MAQETDTVTTADGPATDGDGSATIVPQGDLDLAAIPALRKAIARTNAPKVVLDLRHVEYVDSSGLSLLIAEHRRLQGAARRLVLQHPSPAVVELLRITGLEQFFDTEAP